MPAKVDNFYSKDQFVWNNEKCLEKVQEYNSSETGNGFTPRKLSTGFPLSARTGAFSHRGTIAS